MTVKETYLNRKFEEPSFLDLQEVGGVDDWGMVLDVLFSWIFVT